MKYRWIIGAGPFLDEVHQAWLNKKSNELIEKIEIPQNKDYIFDLSILDNLSPENGKMFVAFNEKLGNFKRAELMQSAIERGFKLEPFISDRAIISNDVYIGLNSFIADGVIIGNGSRVEYNSVILSGVNIGSNVKIKSSCWLEPGSIVGSDADIGSNSILRTGAIVNKKIKIGRYCELGWPQCYNMDIPNKTTFDPRYNEPIYVYGS